jgi:zinc D-Ala-D-Ala carboxypeptidase
VIDWTDEAVLVTPHFSVKDCLWLAHWGRLADASDGLTDDLFNSLVCTCHFLEQVRALLGCPMIITSMYRPSLYSPIVGGTSSDVHTQGIAADFTTIPWLSINDAKTILRPNLGRLDLRMEANTTDWIHIDNHEIGPSGREFIA